MYWVGYIRNTRNDIKIPLSIAASRTGSPRSMDRQAVTKTAAYICTTEEIGLTYLTGPPEEYQETSAVAWKFRCKLGDAQRRCESDRVLCSGGRAQ